MKIKSLIYTTLASTLLFASCDLNKQPVFNDDSQAFIAFESATGIVKEAIDGEAATLEVKLHCASVAGVTAEVTVAVTDTNYAEAMRAVEGVDYVVKSEKTIKFDKDNRFATIIIETINNDIQDGDKKFDIVLTNVKGCNLGANKSFAVTISDDEDPMNMLVGSYSASAVSAFDEVTVDTWDVTITRDDEHDDRLWIHPLCLFGGLGASSIYPVYCVVDVNAGTIQVPNGQTMFESGYNMVNAGLANPPATSGVTLALFTVNGTDVVIEFQDDFGVGDTVSNAWWYAAYYTPTYTKK